MAAPATAALVVMIVFFGEMPPWLPLTLHSMALNERVKFVVIGDAEPPPVVPRNVVFERISYGDMQVRLSRLLDPANESAVRYNWTYKANDIKPLAPALYAHHLAGHEWWAWADLDVVFGDLVKFLSFASRRPACCKVPLRKDGTPKSVNRVNVYSHSGACPCPPNTRANVVCPLYPNPWRKKAWGPFTAFRVDFGAELFRQSPQWREVIVSNEYAHFDEFWGPFHYSRGWETMGDVLTRLAEANGSAIMSKLKLPFAEAKTCRDAACMFCPCGAMRMRLGRGGMLSVNDREVMVLHLAESKLGWRHSASAAALPAWSPAAPDSTSLWSGCVQAAGLGYLSASCGAACSASAPRWGQAGAAGDEERATALTRHRVQTKWAGHIKYPGELAEAAAHPITVGACPAGEPPSIARYEYPSLWKYGG